MPNRWHIELIGAAALILFILYTRPARSTPPLAPELFEDYLGCPSLNLAAESLAPLSARAARHLHNHSMRMVHSTALSTARRRVRALHNIPRVQIINGMLYASCPGDTGCTGIGHELRTLQLLLRVSRLDDVDFFFDGGERPCYVSRRRGRGNNKVHVVGMSVPVVTHETDVSGQGCDANIVAPPRALDALPDLGRWLSRADTSQSSWLRTRRHVVIWRGAATSRGGALFHPDGTAASVRAQAVALSARRPELLDARFAGRNDDLQLSPSDRAAVRARGWGADGVGFITWQQLRRYRAALVLDGNTVADRIPQLLFSGLAMLKQESPLREAWYAKLVPYVHYIPVRADLSDLEAQLEWAMSNETRLHAIAVNGARLAMQWLSRRAQLCHWSGLLRQLGSLTARPVVPEPRARLVDEVGTALLGGAVVHNPFSSALRPMLTGRPFALSDLDAVRDLKLGPCVDLTNSHLCLSL